MPSHSTAGEIIGWENIELISDRPFKLWMDEFKRPRTNFPTACSSLPSWRNTERTPGLIVEKCQTPAWTRSSWNFSCPHGLPERKMGAAMGENPEILCEVVSWVMSAAKKPVWAKMTPERRCWTRIRAGRH